MGTIVNSTPWIQSRPSAKYLDYFFPVTSPKYSDFSSAQNNRNELLWTGSNDGMVHGFSSQTGAPVISYVPRPLVPMLKTLATPGTTTAIVASMDGSPFSGDVLTTHPVSGSPTWKTYLFSSLGRGGKGMFALDVTSTGNSTSSPTIPSSLIQSNASSIFKWQFTDTDDSDLGFVVGDPLPSQFSGQASPIMLLNNGQFAVLTPNGIGSTGGKAVLLILGVDGPGADQIWSSTVDVGQTPKKAEYYRLSTLATDTGNGMMGATWVDIDGNGTADYVYATDLKGNVWKFDIRSNNPTNWESAFKVGANNVPFYVAKSPTGAVLPITTTPALGFPPDGGIMVTFGTGKALESSDFPTSATNRMFGIFDRTGVNSTATVVLATGTTTLLQRVYTEITTGTATGSLITSATPTLDLSSKDGWYFDFPRASEQVLSSPDVRSKNIAFTTVRRADTTIEQCFYTPPGQQYFINPNSGLPSGPTLGLYTDPITNVTYYIAAIPSSDQKVRIINDRSGRVNGGGGGGGGGSGGGGSGACPANSFAYRIVGNNSDKLLCVPTNTSRIQWREVPGMKTRIR